MPIICFHIHAHCEWMAHGCTPTCYCNDIYPPLNITANKTKCYESITIWVIWTVYIEPVILRVFLKWKILSIWGFCVRVLLHIEWKNEAKCPHCYIIKVSMPFVKIWKRNIIKKKSQNLVWSLSVLHRRLYSIYWNQ